MSLRAEGRRQAEILKGTVPLPSDRTTHFLIPRWHPQLSVLWAHKSNCACVMSDRKVLPQLMMFLQVKQPASGPGMQMLPESSLIDVILLD